MSFHYGAAANDGEVLWTGVTDGASVTIRSTAGVEQTIQLLGGGVPMFSSMAVKSGVWAFAYADGQSDNLFILGPEQLSVETGVLVGRPVNLGAKWGNESIFCEVDVVGFAVYFVPGDLITHYRRIRLTPDLKTVVMVSNFPVPPELAPPSSGWVDVVNGEPLWMAGPVVAGIGTYGNETHLTPDLTTVLYCPMTRGNYIGGQADNRAGALPGALCQVGSQVMRVSSVDSPVAPILAVTASGNRAVMICPGANPGPHYSEQWTVESLTPAFVSPKFLGAYPSGAAQCRNIGFDGAVLTLLDGRVLAKWFDTEDAKLHGITPQQLLAGHDSPAAAYCGGSDWPDWTGELREGDAIAFPLYGNSGETFEQLRVRGQKFLDAAMTAKLKAVIVACCWNRTFLSDAEVKMGMACAHRLAVDNAHVLGIIFFGLNRGTPQGWFKPEYQATVDGFASPGVPDWKAPVAQGTVGITSWGPDNGNATLQVKAVANFTGDVKFYRWRYKAMGAEAWVMHPINPVSDSDNTFSFGAGQWLIGVDGLDANQVPIPGASTGAQRLVTVQQVGPTDLDQALALLDAAVAAIKKAVGR
jgi:hypothetical protein